MLLSAEANNRETLMENSAGVVITKCSSPGQLALAYDDGPYQYTQKLSDILKNGGAKGTFFVTGTLYGKDPGA